MSSKAKRKPNVEDARERAWRRQHEARKALGYSDTIRLKPSSVEDLIELAEEDKLPRATVVSNLIDAEKRRRARRR